MKYLAMKTPALLVASIVCLLAASSAFSQATLVIQNGDPTGVGFNDTTPATPVGGNNGTTVGQQRLNAFQAAANIWGATLTSGPTITIRATWDPLPCSASSGTLGSAGNAGSIWRNFSGAVPNFWYGNALANALSGTDRNGPSHEITARFNVSIGTAGCMEALHWYYGLDNNHGATGVDLVSVVLHEFGHGLGFQTYTSSSTGQQAGNTQAGFFPTIFDRFLFDTTAGKTWANMTSDSERVASATNTGNLVWNGPQVLADASGVLSGTPRLRLNSPSSIAGNYQVGTASFGSALPPAGTTANVVQAVPADGCTAISGVAGKIALVDRGPTGAPCSFVTKVKNAQNAGAVAVIVADNQSNSTPPGMGGSDSTITIAAVSITQTDGNIIKGQLANGVNATLLADTSTLAGADSSGRPLMFAPNPVQQGSSVAHWDESGLPNQLMEPSAAGDLFHSVTTPHDLTSSLFKDLGWPHNGAVAPTIVIEEGTTNAATALDSVTKTRGPFTVRTSNNFSADGYRRIILLTTSLGLNPGDNLSVLSVRAQGILLEVESAGPVSGMAQTSYVIVKLNDSLPAGNLPLSVTLRGVNSANSPTITIQ